MIEQRRYLMVKVESLKQQILLEDIDGKGLDEISRFAKEMSFKKGEQIFKEGDSTMGLYLIKSGKVEISKVTLDEWRQILTTLREGYFFGELSLLEGRRHMATAVVTEDAEILFIPKEEFERLLESSLAHRIIKKIAVTLATNLKCMNDKYFSVLVSY
jgi:CRP-like cAMP-binding protein